MPFIKYILHLIIVKPLSFFINSVAFLLIITLILFFSSTIRDALLKNSILPIAETLNLPHIIYDKLYIGKENTLYLTGLVVHDDKKQKFVSARTIAVQPKNFLSIAKGIKFLNIDTITLHKKPFFKIPQTRNKNAEPPKIPFNIEALNIENLILKPAITGQKKDIVLKVNGSVDTNQTVKLTIHSNDYKKLNAHINYNLQSYQSDIRLISAKNKLLFTGIANENKVDGTLKADNFDITQFYTIDPQLTKLALNGDIKLNLDLKKLTKIPNINGQLTVKLDYDKTPINLSINGKNNKKNLDLNIIARHHSNIITQGNITINQQKKGMADFMMHTDYLPNKIQKNLPVKAKGTQLTTNFQIQKNTILLSNGHLTAKKITLKKPLNQHSVTLKNIAVTFDKQKEIFNIHKASFIALVDKTLLNAHLNGQLNQNFIPKSLALSIEKQNNTDQKITISLQEIKKLAHISAHVQKFNPDFLIKSRSPIDINFIDTHFKGTVNLNQINILKTINGTLTGIVKQNEQASIRIDSTIKKGNIKGDYKLFTADKQTGNGTLSIDRQFKNSSSTTTIDLSTLSSFLHKTEHRLTGKLNAHINLVDKTLTGDFDIKNASYKNLLYGTEINNINLKGTAYSDYIHITSFTATGINNGTLSSQGIISLTPQKQSTLIFKTKAFTPIIDDMISVTVDSLLKVTGFGKNLMLSGDIALNNMNILLPDIQNNDIPKLNIVRKQDTKENIETEKISLLDSIKTNINLVVTEGAKISGFGLKGFPFGRLNIQNKLADPKVNGQIKIARGSMEILGKSFQISNGGIYLKETKPLLNVEATRTIDDTTITLNLKGTIDNPIISFYATPAIPQDEVIALLVFGKNKDELSPFQALRLANAFYQLSRGKSGVGGKFDVLGNTERFLNIDHLTINSDSNNAISIGVGKYINDKIYVGTDYNPSTTDSAFLLELKLSDTLTLKTRLTNASQGTNSNEIMLEKRKDY